MNLWPMRFASNAISGNMASILFA